MSALRLFIISIFLVHVLLSPAFANETPPNIKEWCSQTPNPEPCEYFLSQKTNSHSVKEKSDFHKASVQIALERALRAKSYTSGLGPKCRNKKEKAAWDDCLELYETTILKLNQTVDTYKCTEDDSQTWLSAALTNLETCRTGFVELGVADNLLPLMSNNVSKLICNSLSVNKISPGKEKYKHGYPKWVSPGDRKLLQTVSPAADVVVAADGSGNYKTIKEAIDAAGKRKGTARFVIHVKAGTYKENVVAGNKVKNVMLLGDGIGKTIITGSKSVGGGSTTFNSATFAVTGDGFIGRGVTFRNTAGAANHQAVALRSGSDLSVFYQCSIEGYQDSLYVHSQRQFYRECNVYGTVDFIFGNAAVVLQSCNLYARKPMANQKCVVTAQGRTDPNENTGISIHNSKILATSDLGSTPTYLGRPWKQYSRTVYLKSFIGSHIVPAGWLEWSGNFALNTLYYGEYLNTGPGAATAKRVKWKGYHVITSATEASKFSVGSFIAGSSWLPSTKVPFTSGI
ncbi:hypothetical protein GIB67_008763 [Kingdonia uniflora]|uniref:Pectinesterase n=1 Tax=Kingdonia uniflora TaxID=39325 RepID=A0A7J7P6A6_9MAGN|nr:hypothetical protein GIB67_008763 [Kingdonia uniflora]